MINQVVSYINSKLDLKTNYGLCEKVYTTTRDDVEQSHIQTLEGAIIDFDKAAPLSYILPNGEVSASESEIEGIGGQIIMVYEYPIKVVIYKERCELPEFDEIAKYSKAIVTNNNYTLVTNTKAFQGASINLVSANHNKNDVFAEDFENVDFKIKLSHILISLTFNVQLSIDVECDTITTC